jgi:hypothetical protein
MKRFASLLVVAGLGLMLASCYPNRLDNVSTYDIVATKYEKATNFASAGTYAIKDEVIPISPDGSGDYNHQYDDLIVGTVVSNMNARGYTRVSDPATADLVITCAVTQSTYYDYYYSYGCGYYWYYCGYYPYPVVTSYEVGTLFIAMADGRQATSGDPPTAPIVWLGAVNGVLNYGGNPSNRITSGINQAFQQSSYLKSQASS